MKNYYTFLSLTLFLFCFTINSYSQSFLRAEGKEIVNEQGEAVLLRGMGLGGWMLQEGYMLQTAGFANAQHKIWERIEQLIGKEDTDAFYEAWLANHVRKIDIDSLKAWGFNSVRLPMHYNLFTLPIEDEPVPGEQTWLTKGFDLTDSLLAWCKANEMYLVLDLHAAPGGQGRDEGISDYDTSKPSLWESKANRDKTIALWKRLAEKYKDEPWIAGYDLINETNWPMDGNIPLRDLYFELTDSIRSVDTKHIIFIEGNWFANDFTGLTPPWDDNLVYSPHKYWSVNDQASIQWVLDIREQYNVPLYFGESGENSNVWFRDAIKLFEDNNIGWAWWPMKKVESIAGPLSLPKSQAYQDLLDYWNNGGVAPSAASAKATLMALAEGMKLENCTYQKDVIDAMFRQVRSDETRPFAQNKIPGVIYASDFDMGLNGEAYFDTEIANFQVTTGNYTSWNNGWVYRNDGVDLEKTENNPINSNGVHAGWMEKDEWLQYTVEVAESAVYDVRLRIAANTTTGKLKLSSGGADISSIVSVPNSNGWQNWQSMIVPNVILSPSDKNFRFHVVGSGYNLASFEFIKKGASTSVLTDFLSAITVDEQTIQLNLNKPMGQLSLAGNNSFSIFKDGSPLPITEVKQDADNSRIIYFTLNYEIRSEDKLLISYNGNDISAEDGTSLNRFQRKEIQNTIAILHALPGRVQAEDYFFQQGIQLENTSDTGGGQNIGFLDIGDYADYLVDVPQNGLYGVEYRTAALSEQGQVQMQLISPNGEITFLHTATFPATGGWQTWTTTSALADLPQGEQQIRVVITAPLFNINWFEFSLITSNDPLSESLGLQVFPNPTIGNVAVRAELEKTQEVEIEVLDLLGKRLVQKRTGSVMILKEDLDISFLANGVYFVKIRLEDGRELSQKLLKTNN